MPQTLDTVLAQLGWRWDDARAVHLCTHCGCPRPPEGIFAAEHEDWCDWHGYSAEDAGYA
jgi:hypothetical protein